MRPVCCVWRCFLGESRQQQIAIWVPSIHGKPWDDSTLPSVEPEGRSDLTAWFLFISSGPAPQNTYLPTYSALSPGLLGTSMRTAPEQNAGAIQQCREIPATHSDLQRPVGLRLKLPWKRLEDEWKALKWTLGGPKPSICLGTACLLALCCCECTPLSFLEH